MKPKLHIIIGSTRPGRIGPAVAHWFKDFAAQHDQYEPELVDLAEMALPLFDEPQHPARRQYEHEHTKRWSAKVKEADAVVIVTPEYNHNPPPSLVNALDYLVWEWQYMPMGVVSYGGVSGGLRSAQVVRAHAATLKMVPIPEGVALPNVFAQLSDGKFNAIDLNEQGAMATLNEMRKWSDALAGLRATIREM